MIIKEKTSNTHEPWDSIRKLVCSKNLLLRKETINDIYGPYIHNYVCKKNFWKTKVVCIDEYSKNFKCNWKITVYAPEYFGVANEIANIIDKQNPKHEVLLVG